MRWRRSGGPHERLRFARRRLGQLVVAAASFSSPLALVACALLLGGPPLPRLLTTANTCALLSRPDVGCGLHQLERKNNRINDESSFWVEAHVLGKMAVGPKLAPFRPILGRHRLKSAKCSPEIGLISTIFGACLRDGASGVLWTKNRVGGQLWRSTLTVMLGVVRLRRSCLAVTPRPPRNSNTGGIRTCPHIPVSSVTFASVSPANLQTGRPFCARSGRACDHE